MAGGKSSKQKAVIAERRQHALSLRKSGASYRAIAAHIAKLEDEATGELLYPKYSEGAAYTDVKACLDEINAKTALDTEEYRALELERLDTAQLAIAQKVKAGDVFAIDRWLRISERRAALLGLDAPVRLRIEQGVEAELNNFLSTLESCLPPDVFTQVLTAVSTVASRSEAAARN